MQFASLRLGAALLVLPVPGRQPVLAQAVASGITWTQVRLTSAALTGNRRYFVALPAGYNQGADRYPVLVILDADDQNQFVAALANIRFLSSRLEVPRLIVVGVPNGSDRTHDLTPSTTQHASLFPTAGGADRFLAFLSQEVLPAVRARYRTMPLTILAGHSFGGLFGVYIAAEHPGTFDATIAMSPALYWNGPGNVARYVGLLAKQSAPHRLFVSSGGYEPIIDTPTVRFASVLDSTPKVGVAFGHRRYPDITHSLSPMTSLIDGLRFVFEPMSLAAMPREQFMWPARYDSATLVSALDQSAERYGRSAPLFGFSPTLPEGYVDELGHDAMDGFGQPGAAVAIFRKNIGWHPESAKAYDALGDALLASHDSAAARAAFSRAVEIGKRTHDPAAAESAKKLRRLAGSAE